MSLEGFEEVEEPFEDSDNTAQTQQTAQGKEPERKKGTRPDFRVVQTELDKEGKTVYKSVGAMWKTISKNGKEFYVMKIGELRLLVFKNE